jgi:hypothetical protein
MRPYFKATQVIALVAFVASSNSVLADEVNPLKDGTFAIDQCAEMVQFQKTTLQPLLKNGFEVKKKRKRWKYTKKRRGASVQVSTVPSDVATGCSIVISGVRKTEADGLYKHFQGRFLGAGYRTVAKRDGLYKNDYFVKGTQAIFYRGLYENGAAVIRFHHRRKEK